MITPTAFSQFLAGIGLWGIGWSVIFHIEELAKLLRLGRFVNKDRILAWINRHKVMALLMTEFVNLGTHDIESPSSITFALGGTCMNIIMIFIVIPVIRPLQKIKNSLLFWVR
jgi:hypothetical protein